MNSSEKKSLQISACKIRLGAVEGVYHAKSGHPGGSLSAADLYAYLYFQELNIDPENPKWRIATASYSLRALLPGFIRSLGGARLFQRGRAPKAASHRRNAAKATLI